MNKRFLLKKRIEVIRTLISIDDDNTTWKSVVGRAISQIIGVKSNIEKLKASIEKLGYKKAIKYIDLYIRDQIETKEKEYEKISRAEHALNKKKWKSLQEKFKTFLDSQI